MSNHDFTVRREEEIISIGIEGESIAFDISFIPSDKGYEIQQILASRPQSIPPELMARVILIAARGQVDESITPEWVMSHTDIKTINRVFVLVLNKAYGRAEKNG